MTGCCLGVERLGNVGRTACAQTFQMLAAAYGATVNPASARLPRDPWADNARLVAATLIVVMHLLEPVLARSATAESLYWTTWPLRVPLFVLVAGYFSDARPLDDRRTVVLLRNVLGVYLVWDAIAFLRRGIVDDVWRYEPLYPAFGLWFLLALFWWRLTLPLLVRVRGAGALVVVLALGAGFMPQLGQSFGGSRTFVYLPLFWLGWWLRARGARALVGTARARLAGGVALGASVAGLFVLSRFVGRGILRFAGMYGGGWEQQVGEAGLRGLVLVLGALGAMGLLALTPTRRVAGWTALGAGSMTVYVVHPVLVQQAKSTGLFDAVRAPRDFVVLVAVGVVLSCVLACPPVRAVLRPLVQPRGTWWLVRSALQAPAPRVVDGPEGAGAADAAVAAPRRTGRTRVVDLVVRGGRGQPCDERDELEVVGGAAQHADAGERVGHESHLRQSSSSSMSRSRLTDQPSTV